MRSLMKVTCNDLENFLSNILSSLNVIKYSSILSKVIFVTDIFLQAVLDCISLANFANFRELVKL